MTSELTNKNLILHITDSPHSGRDIHLVNGQYIVEQHDFCLNKRYKISKEKYQELRKEF